ncbi:hypothetical protein B5C34_05850 [Pacificimonas flava]|uniref:Lipoprotein n=2 Tax=Pacificimonas TaxID=1960290 RepID=A0A219B438_9SPHN|nr:MULTISPECIES: hypothetical protein [Pacificimonas]MBZ6377254.1 hypothetical protein [Pacificimonas aurantium]OWV33031.1 hypothetical protein B5C34_05850 [Pacificimonas flava]
MPRLIFQRAALPALLLMAACSEETIEAPEMEQPETAGFVGISELGGEAPLGAWATEGGDCTAPDFRISDDGGERPAVEAEFNGWDRTGRLRSADSVIRFVDPTKNLPIALEDGGLRVFPPPDGLAVLGSRNLFEEGVLFRKCAEAAD